MSAANRFEYHVSRTWAAGGRTLVMSLVCHCTCGHTHTRTHYRPLGAADSKRAPLPLILDALTRLHAEYVETGHAEPVDPWAHLRSAAFDVYKRTGVNL